MSGEASASGARGDSDDTREDTRETIIMRPLGDNMAWDSGNACQRWVTDISKWSPSDSEWEFLLGLIPDTEAKEVLRYRQPADQKRALVSRLMQRKSASVALGIPHKDVVIKRTKGRKPFVANDCTKSHAPNFNFNVSHEGDYVVLASEPFCICGIDVAAPRQVMRKGQQQSMEEIKKTFLGSFTSHEWNAILGPGNEEEQRSVFRQHWSLKEAYVKARGDGIGFELGQCEFVFEGDCRSADTAFVKMGGILVDKWKFHLSKLPSEHWVSVARGPPSDIVDAFGEFKASLQSPDFEHDLEQYQNILHSADAPAFTWSEIKDLVPLERLDEFLELIGEACATISHH